MRIIHYVDEANLAWGRPWMQLILTLEKKDFTNLVVCPPGGTLSGFLKEHSVPYLHAKAPAPWFPPLCREVRSAFLKAKPDIIHTRLSAAARIGGYWGKKLGIPVISTIDKYPKIKYYTNTEVVVGCSSAVTDHMLKIGFPAERAVTTHNPVDGEFYRRNQKEREAFRSEVGVGVDEVIILGLGRFVDWKAFDVLVKACEKVDQFKNWRLWLVGDGPEREKLELLVDQLNLRDRTTFWGYATDIRRYLWASDLFIQPSNKPEGFSLAILEAMSAGLPAVATRIGGTLDLLGGGGLLPFEVDDVEGLAAIMQNFLTLPREKQKKMDSEAALSASKFYLDIISDHYGDMYRSIYSNCPGRNRTTSPIGDVLWKPSFWKGAE